MWILAKENVTGGLLEGVGRRKPNICSQGITLHRILLLLMKDSLEHPPADPVESSRLEELAHRQSEWHQGKKQPQDRVPR